MSLISGYRGKNYYRHRILITFSLVTVSLVVVMSLVSYRFVRDLYIDQVSENVNDLVGLMASEIDTTYLQFLNVGKPGYAVKNYFHKLMIPYLSESGINNIFIFNDQLRIMVHTDFNIEPGYRQPNLLLSKTEIFDLKPGQTNTSLPFKGADGKWYLWGFYRFDSQYWLAFRESVTRLEKVEQFALSILMIGAAGVIFTIILALFLANSVLKPLGKLSRFSTELGRGNFRAVMPKKMYGEIENLAMSMDSMRRDLKTHQKEKEEMLAQIAHEIRNPLGGIELLTNLVKENPAGKSEQYLNEILKEISGLKSLITAYLEYSRPYPAKPQWVNVRSLLDEIQLYRNERAAQKNITVVTSNNLEKIWFDPVQLKRILINLINNSMDAINKAGRITIDVSQQNGMWKISISDNGPGIAAEQVADLFKPFNTNKSNGTGLGLAISKKLCAENQAQLVYESNPGNGCTFHIIKEIRYENR